MLRCADESECADAIISTLEKVAPDCDPNAAEKLCASLPDALHPRIVDGKVQIGLYIVKRKQVRHNPAVMHEVRLPLSEGLQASVVRCTL